MVTHVYYLMNVMKKTTDCIQIPTIPYHTVRMRVYTNRWVVTYFAIKANMVPCSLHTFLSWNT